MENTNLQQSKKGGVLPLLLGIAALVITFMAIIFYIVGLAVTYSGHLEMLVNVFSSRVVYFIFALIMPILALALCKSKSRPAALILAIVNVLFLGIQLMAGLVNTLVIFGGMERTGLRQLVGGVNGSGLINNLYSMFIMVIKGYGGRGLITNAISLCANGCFALKHIVCALAFAIKAFKKK